MHGSWFARLSPGEAAEGIISRHLAAGPGSPGDGGFGHVVALGLDLGREADVGELAGEDPLGSTSSSSRNSSSPPTTTANTKSKRPTKRRSTSSMAQTAARSSRGHDAHRAPHPAARSKQKSPPKPTGSP